MIQEGLTLQFAFPHAPLGFVVADETFPQKDMEAGAGDVVDVLFPGKLQAAEIAVVEKAFQPAVETLVLSAGERFQVADTEQPKVMDEFNNLKVAVSDDDAFPRAL